MSLKCSLQMNVLSCFVRYLLSKKVSICRNSETKIKRFIMLLDYSKLLIKFLKYQLLIDYPRCFNTMSYICTRPTAIPPRREDIPQENNPTRSLKSWPRLVAQAAKQSKNEKRYNVEILTQVSPNAQKYFIKLSCFFNCSFLRYFAYFFPRKTTPRTPQKK